MWLRLNLWHVWCIFKPYRWGWTVPFVCLSTQLNLASMAGTKCSHSACEMGRKDRGPLLLFDEWLWNQCGWALTVGTDTFINALFLTSRYISWLWALIKRQTASLCVFVFVTIKLCLTVSIFDISDVSASYLTISVCVCTKHFMFLHEYWILCS